MRRIIYSLLLLFFYVFGKAQIVTTFSGSPGTSSDGSHKWDVSKVEIFENGVLVHFEITVLKPIRRLNIYDDDSRILYGSEVNREGLGLKGDYTNGEIHYLGRNSSWGWNQIGRGEKVGYVLYFGGGSGKGNSIPSGATKISIYGIGVEADGKKTSWKWENININNPRRYYTNYSSEYSIKQYLDANNDGICGIYEVMGDDTGSKFACVKHNGEYALIFISDNIGRNWWKVGDIKATLRQSASGILKANWYMSDKSKYNKDCYVGFDGVSMTVLFPSESNEKEREKKYLKMYPTTPPSYNEYQQERTPQRQQQIPQRKQIPILKKQNIKK